MKYFPYIFRSCEYPQLEKIVVDISEYTHWIICSRMASLDLSMLSIRKEYVSKLFKALSEQEVQFEEINKEF
jgi:hypothetical protein